jgi:hypothetical protein
LCWRFVHRRSAHKKERGLHFSRLHRITLHVGRMFHVACYSLLVQLDPENLAKATVTIARSFLSPLVATVLFIRGNAWLHVPTLSVLWLTGLLRRMRTGKMRPQLRGDETLRSSDGVCRLATLAPLAGLAGRTRNGRWLSMPRTPAWRSGVCGLTGRLVRLQA